MSISAKQAFRARLVGAPAVTRIVDRDIFFEKAPQDAVRPYVVLSGSATHERHMGGTCGISPCQMSCDIFAKTDTEATALSSAVRMTCDGFRGAVVLAGETVYFRHSELKSDSDAFIDPPSSGDDGIYHIHQDWSVIITEPVTTF